MMLQHAGVHFDLFPFVTRISLLNCCILPLGPPMLSFAPAARTFVPNRSHFYAADLPLKVNQLGYG